MTWQWCGLVQLYEQIGTAVLQYGQNGYARTGDGQRTASDGSWTLKVVPPQKYDCWAASLRKDQKRPIVTNFRSFSRGFHIYMCVYITDNTQRTQLYEISVL